MTKVLHVIKPFGNMNTGDTLEFDAESGMYKNTYNEERHESNDNSNSVYASYMSVYSISADYAKMLIEDGYLAEDKEDKKKNSPFVNVFDEIDNMLEAYNDDLDNLDEDMASQPACLKVEKETVLNNLIKALNHLKDLRK